MPLSGKKIHWIKESKKTTSKLPRYGSTIGGRPAKNPYCHAWSLYGNCINDWCRQLFPNTSIKGTATYSNYIHYPGIRVQPPVAGMMWCNSYDEKNYHWCEWLNGKWKDITWDTRKYYYGTHLMDSVTCQIP